MLVSLSCTPLRAFICPCKPELVYRELTHMECRFELTTQQFLTDIDMLLPTLGTKPHLVVLASQVRRQASCKLCFCCMRPCCALRLLSLRNAHPPGGQPANILSICRAHWWQQSHAAADC